MTIDHVQPLNYSAHAIDDLRGFANTMQTIGADMSAVAVRRLSAMLRDSVKFLLPNCGELIDIHDFRQSHLDLVRLPFPCVAFEAPWDKGDEGVLNVGDVPMELATRRIALCWDARPEFEVLPGMVESTLTKFPEGGMFVMPFYWTPSQRSWMPTLGGSFIPYDNQVERNPANVPMSTQIARQAAIDAGLAKTGASSFRAEPFLMLPEVFDNTLQRNGGDRDRTFAQIIIDSRDEVLMMVQACTVLNCANVRTENVEPSAKLNKKRQAADKQPFFTYKVLQVTGEVGATGGGQAVGSHASPRTHLRRGHIRRLDARTIWVRPTMVNAGSLAGTVTKDYAIQRPAAGRRR